jgi:hypothetical protein
VVRRGVRVRDNLIVVPMFPVHRLEGDADHIVVRRLNGSVVEIVLRAEVVAVHAQFHRPPLEARSVLRFECVDGSSWMFHPLRLRSTAFALEELGWPVVWRFRWPRLRAALARRSTWIDAEEPCRGRCPGRDVA